MKLIKTDHKGEQIDWEDHSDHEQRLMMLISGIKGNYKTDYMGMEKAMSVRLSAMNYPKVKALSNLSGNSLNLIINDLVEVAYGVIIDNASDESAQELLNAENLARAEWVQDSKKEQK